MIASPEVDLPTRKEVKKAEKVVSEEEFAAMGLDSPSNYFVTVVVVLVVFLAIGLVLSYITRS